MKLLPRKQFARRVSLLMGGTAGGQLLMILISPLLTRLYSPEDFGLLAAFLAVLSVLVVVASGRYDLAIVLPEDDQKGVDVLVLASLCLLTSAVVVFVLQLLLGDYLSGLLNAPELGKYLWMLPVGVVFLGFYQIFQNWAIRKKSFHTLALTKVWQAFATSILQIIFFKAGAIALIGGQVFGQGVGSYRLAKPTLTSAQLKKTRLSQIFAAAKEYKDLPIYSTWSALLNTASLQLAPFLLFALYGASAAGLYALTHRVLSMPAGLIGKAVGHVFLAEAPEARRRGELPGLVQDLNTKLSLVGLVPLFLVVFFGPGLFSLVFGDQWRDGGVYAQWVSVWLYFQFQWSPISMIAITLELHKQLLVVQILSISLRIGVLAGCYYLSADVLTAIAAFSVVSALSYVARSLYFMHKAGVQVLKASSGMLFVFFSSYIYLIIMSGYVNF